MSQSPIIWSDRDPELPTQAPVHLAKDHVPAEAAAPAPKSSSAPASAVPARPTQTRRGRDVKEPPNTGLVSSGRTADVAAGSLGSDLADLDF